MQTLQKGFLIAVEGIDGCGKTTLAQGLLQALSRQSFPVVLTKEPGGTQLGKTIRSLLQEQIVPIRPLTEYLLFAADRAQHFHEIIKPALQQKKIVISDRLSDSSLAYQGYGRALDINMIAMVNQWAMQAIEADLTIYVRVSAQTAYQRIRARKKTLTAFEKETINFFERVIEGFDSMYENKDNVMRIDGEEACTAVLQTTLHALPQWIMSPHN